MSRSLTVSGVVPAMPPISSTSAAEGVDSMRSVPTCSACACTPALAANSSTAAPACTRDRIGWPWACMSERGVEAEEDVVFAAQVAGEVGAGRLGLVLEIDVELDDALDVAHEVVRRGQAQAVDVDAFVDGVGAREVAGAGAVVQCRERPAVIGNPVHAGEAAAPAIVARGIGIEKTVPAVPQVLRVPVDIGTGVAGRVEADDAFVGVALARVHAGRAGGAVLLAHGAEDAHGHRADVGTDVGEGGFGAVVVEHPIRPRIAGAVDLEVVGDAVAVGEAEVDAERPDVTVEQHAAIVSDASHAV